MITTVGYVLAGLNLFLTVLFASRRRVEDRIEELKTTIREELSMAYSEWAEQAYQPETEWRNIGESDAKSSRLSRLHFSLLGDYTSVHSASVLARSALWVSMLLLAMATGSVIAAAVAVDQGVDARSWIVMALAIAVPFVAFVAQGGVFGKLEWYAKLARDLSGKYTRKEY